MQRRGRQNGGGEAPAERPEFFISQGRSPAALR